MNKNYQAPWSDPKIRIPDGPDGPDGWVPGFLV